MSSILIVHKSRTNKISVNLGMDVSGDDITSEIRSEPNVSAPLLATWEVAFVTDGSDGELILTLDDLVTSEIKATTGYMDILRMVDGEPTPIFERPLEVTFRGSVTKVPEVVE